MNFNPAVDPEVRKQILTALDFSDAGRGAGENEFARRSGVAVGDFGRGLLQMSNEGLVEDWGKSKWYGRGWKITPKGKAWLAAPVPEPVPCRALVPYGHYAAYAPLASAPKPDPFLEEIMVIVSAFEAGLTFDNLDLMRAAFFSLVQNAWAAHVLRTGDPRLRCPVLPMEVER